MAAIDPTSIENPISLGSMPPTGQASASGVNQVDASGATAPITAPQMVPSQITETPTWNNTADQSVQGQVAKIIGNDSPLIQQARANAMQQMNSRGLINSSIAASAGDSAVLGAALPMAQADAAQASKVAQTNVANTNQNLNANMAAKNTAAQSNLSVANQQNVAGIEAGYKQLVQGSASSAAILNNAQNAINAIIANNNLDGPAKDKAVADIRTNLSNSMSMIGALAGDVNLGAYINEVLA